MDDRRDLPFAVDPTRVLFDVTRPDGPSASVRNAGSSSPWAVVEVLLPWNAVDVIVLRPNGGAQPLHPSIEGLATFIVLRDALFARQPTLLRYSVNGRRIEHPLALSPAPPA